MPISIIAVTLAMVVVLLSALRIFAATSTNASEIAPADPAGVAFVVEPEAQGSFTQAGAKSLFEVTLENSGTTPTDTYEVDVSSTWPVTLYGPDGSTPLTDTNGNGSIDTGVVAMGQVFRVKAMIEAPAAAAVGAANTAMLIFGSTISPTLTSSAIMQSAVPAPFAQSLYSQPNRAMNVIMSQPDNSWHEQVTADGWYEQGSTAADLALAETVPGYLYVWTNLRYNDQIEVWRAELEYTLTDKGGEPYAGITKLTDHTAVTSETLDVDPAVAVAPDGRMAVAWYRKIRRTDGSQNYNVFLSILDQSGQPLTGTINVTNNDDWRAAAQPEYDVPAFHSPRVAATDDNRFFVTWESSVLTYTVEASATNDYNLDDIYFAIYESGGVSVTQPIKLSNNIPGADTQSVEPAVAAVDADGVFVTWVQRSEVSLPSRYGDIMFSVVDSAGSVVEGPTMVIDDDLPNDWLNADVQQLSTGNILVAWRAYGCDGYEWSPRIRYAVYKANNYNRVGQPSCLPATIAADGFDIGVSLVADNQGRAIVTWTDGAWYLQEPDQPRERLYYALLNANGNVLTDPMTFYLSRPPGSQVSTGLQGYASASRVFVDAAIAINPVHIDGAIGNPVDMEINYQNLGAVTGTGVIVTVSLAPGLTYLSDNAPDPSTADGQDITWSLAALSPWSDESFTVQVEITDTAELMQSYPLTASIILDTAEASLDNNNAQAEILIRDFIYLPAIVKPD